MRQRFGDVTETFVGMNAPAAPVAATAGAPQVRDTVQQQLKELADLHTRVY